MGHQAIETQLNKTVELDYSQLTDEQAIELAIQRADEVGQHNNPWQGFAAYGKLPDSHFTHLYGIYSSLPRDTNGDVLQDQVSLKNALETNLMLFYGIEVAQTISISLPYSQDRWEDFLGEYAQKVLVLLHTGKFVPDSQNNIRAYFKRISANLCVDSLRRNKLTFQEVSIEETPDIAITDHHHELSLTRSEMVELLRIFSPRDYYIFMEFYVEKTPLIEIAKSLQIGLSAVKSILHRGRMRLAQRLEESSLA